MSSEPEKRSEKSMAQKQSKEETGTIQILNLPKREIQEIMEIMRQISICTNEKYGQTVYKPVDKWTEEENIAVYKAMHSGQPELLDAALDLIIKGVADYRSFPTYGTYIYPITQLTNNKKHFPNVQEQIEYHTMLLSDLCMFINQKVPLNYNPYDKKGVYKNPIIVYIKNFCLKDASGTTENSMNDISVGRKPYDKTMEVRYNNAVAFLEQKGLRYPSPGSIYQAMLALKEKDTPGHGEGEGRLSLSGVYKIQSMMHTFTSSDSTIGEDGDATILDMIPDEKTVEDILDEQEAEAIEAAADSWQYEAIRRMPEPYRTILLLDIQVSDNLHLTKAGKKRTKKKNEQTEAVYQAYTAINPDTRIQLDQFSRLRCVAKMEYQRMTAKNVHLHTRNPRTSVGLQFETNFTHRKEDQVEEFDIDLAFLSEVGIEDTELDHKLEVWKETV